MKQDFKPLVHSMNETSPNVDFGVWRTSDGYINKVVANKDGQLSIFFVHDVDSKKGNRRCSVYSIRSIKFRKEHLAKRINSKDVSDE